MTKLSVRVPSTDTFISGATNAGLSVRKLAPDTVEFRSGLGLCGRLQFAGRHSKSVITITRNDESRQADVAMRNLGRAFPTMGVV